MTIDMSQFFQVFFDEAEELLAEMERLLLALDLGAPDSEDLNAIFRAAHSIKGGAATFGLNDMSEVTHIMESLLDLIRKGQMGLTTEHVNAFLTAKDILKMQLDGHRLGAAVQQNDVAAVRTRLELLLQNAAPAQPQPIVPAPAPSPSGATTQARRYRLQLPALAARDVEALAAELGLLGQVEVEGQDGDCPVLYVATMDSLDDIVAICSFVIDADAMTVTQVPACGTISDGAIRAAAEQARGYGFFEPLESAVRERYGDEARGYGFFHPIEQIRAGTANSAGVPAHATASDDERDKKAVHKGADATSIRVPVEKVDQLINLIGELVITQAMIEQRAGSLDAMLHERLLACIGQMTRNTRDLQEAVMSIRMMPMDFVFSRFPRMVHDLAAKLGKKIDLVTSGAATELDKGLIERIVDPLTHLVRNSIDHGIEMPAARLAAGKSEAGRLSLSASHQGGNIVIEVADDGAGLNRERILAKAEKEGLKVAADIADSELWQVIFAPGFSTAEIVTDVSGRGVGMDVVKRNIAAMGGSVEIRSAQGFGTTISIALPLTLAILDGMSIRVGAEVYILPLGYVIESLKPAQADIKDISGQGRVVRVRGEYLPLIALHQMFSIEPRSTDPTDGIVVILESEGRKAALLVDDLVGQQQVVVKNLESNYRKVSGISGATILSDGGVALILDVAALIRSSRQLAGGAVFS